MTRVDFYVLDSPADPRERFACRLVEKAYQQGHRVYVHVDNAGCAQRFDELLWTFRSGSFVPHGVIAPAGDSVTPVHIGYNGDPVGHEDVLVNLASEVPLFFSRFQRVAEVIDTDESVRRQGRERFRFYRDRGYTLKSHKLS